MIWLFLYGLLAGITYNFFSTIENDKELQAEFPSNMSDPIARYTAKILLSVLWPLTWMLIFGISIIDRLKEKL